MVPALIPLTSPEELTVAIEVFVLLQVPPLTVEVNVEALPTQIDCVPESVPAEAAAVTEIVIVSEKPELTPSVAARLK